MSIYEFLYPTNTSDIECYKILNALYLTPKELKPTSGL